MLMLTCSNASRPALEDSIHNNVNGYVCYLPWPNIPTLKHN